jgi:hypothetical protein
VNAALRAAQRRGKKRPTGGFANLFLRIFSVNTCGARLSAFRLPSFFFLSYFFLGFAGLDRDERPDSTAGFA